VASGTKSNQHAALMNTGTPVVNRKLAVGATTLAPPTVALEHRITLSGEPEAGVRLASITPAAQTSSPEPIVATGTEKPGLPIPRESTAGR
jgi:hypothetical protein